MGKFEKTSLELTFYVICSVLYGCQSNHFDLNIP
jgi:hypothetical protein